MKLLTILGIAALLCSCADMKVTRNYGSSAGARSVADAKDFDGKESIHFETNCGVAATNPRAIYIRPFCLTNAVGRGDLAPTDAEASIRLSLIPVTFADDLKDELAKLAPTRVLQNNEAPTLGWLVEGQFNVIDGGSPTARFFFGTFGAGQSFLMLHVRVTDVTKKRVIYEFDLAGGSHAQGPFGTLRAGGLGTAIPFDLHNAAERIMLVLSPDPHLYGTRDSVVQR